MIKQEEKKAYWCCDVLSSQSKKNNPSMHKNTTHTSHHTPKRTEGTIIFCFFLSHRRTPSGRKWMNVHMKRSNSCLLCYTVCDYNFHYSTSPHTPYGALFFQLFPYPCIVCDIIFYYFASLAPTQDGSSARRVCLETMLSRWKEQVKWEKREEDKKRKRECVCGLFFFSFSFCSCPRLFNFIWDYWAWWV